MHQRTEVNINAHNNATNVVSSFQSHLASLQKDQFDKIPGTIFSPSEGTHIDVADVACNYMLSLSALMGHLCNQPDL